MDVINTNDNISLDINIDRNTDSNTDSNEIVKQPAKKRGRKPKVYNTETTNTETTNTETTNTETTNTETTNTETTNTETTNTEIKEKKKRTITKEKKNKIIDILDVSQLDEFTLIDKGARGAEALVVIDKGARGAEALVAEALVAEALVDDDIAMKTKRRGRKPKDKFKFESSEYDEFQKNSKKEDNIIIKLPLSCLKLNEEFNIGKELFSYNPNLSLPKPYKQEYIINKHNIGFSMLNNDNDKDENDNILGNLSNKDDNLINYSDAYENACENACENADGNADGNVDVNVDENVDENVDGNVDGNADGNASINADDIILYNDNLNNKSNNNKKNIEKTINIQNIHKSIRNNNKLQLISNTHYCDKCSHCQKIKNDEDDVRQIDIILNNKYNSNTDKFNVLTHLGININGSKWIEKTDVACLFCCHSFKETPWGIPYKYKDGKFQLFGNFCLPNCGLAYILHTYKDDDSLWEKVALLNLLCFKVYGKYKNLQPSFDKMALIMFGGTLDIIEYRKIISSNEKTYSIEFPPCNTIIPMLEEIYKKSALSNTFIPIDNNRINIANNELKLKRSKPIINHKNTLDFCLGKI